MPWGAVVRADDGGLGNQLAELCRHVCPDRVLIVNPGGRRNRGTLHTERYEHVAESQVFDGDVLTEDVMGWFLDGLDTTWAAECWYSPRFVNKAREHGVRTVIQANPELLVDGIGSDLITLPTTWEAHRHPDARYLPVPIARDRLPERPHSGRFRTLYHPAAPAMLDRNGTDLLLSSLRYCRTGFRVLVRGREGERTKVGNSIVEYLPHVDDYPDAYPPEADAIVLPRRYGGLSLSMQEAASLGLPIVSLDLEPQRGWLDPAGLVPAVLDRETGMRGGRFGVYGANPRVFAQRLDDLADDPATVARLRSRSLRWAESLCWSRWADAYERLLCA